MFKQNISIETWGSEKGGKYRLRDSNGNSIDQSPEDTCDRIAKTLSKIEKDSNYWYNEFKKILGYKFAAGGRIMANIGADQYKKDTSSINCVVSRQIPDSMFGIMSVVLEAALILRAGCGVGYDFSTIRPKDAYIFGAGAKTSGVLSFMKIFDTTCSTILSGGGRRGAQLAGLDIQHPEIESFILAKREKGAFKYFNLSVLITDEFMNAVKNNKNWDLWFWQKTSENITNDKVKLIKKDDLPYNHSDYNYFSFSKDHVEVIYSKRSTSDIFEKKIYKSCKAKDLYDMITKSTYTYSDPGFILIDRVNRENNLWFMETIRTTNPCQPKWATVLTPNGISTIGNIDIGDIIWSGKQWTKVINKKYTGNKPVYSYTTSAGTFYGTQNHRVVSNEKKVEVKYALTIDASTCDDFNIDIPKDYESYKNDGLLINKYLLIPSKYIYADNNTKRYFLRGLFSSNGFIDSNKIVLIIDQRNIKVVQEMLSSIGILSTCTKDYKIIIDSFIHIKIFNNIIGFSQNYKNLALSRISTENKPETTFDITEVMFLGKEEVYDITVEAEEHTYWTGGLLVSNCGEQPLPPLSNCLLGSMILCSYIKDPFDINVSFDWESFKKDVRIASRLLDNVVELNNLPLQELSNNLILKRRHGLGFTGLGSALNMLRLKYNSKEGLEFAENVSKTLAQESLLVSIELAKEKGAAPFAESIENKKLFLQSEYLTRLLDTFPNKEEIISSLLEFGIRWSHATSIAPTGTLSITWGNNCSSGLEPVFANSYLRNFRIEGKKTKTQEEVFDYSYFEWKKLNNEKLPEWWTTTDDLSVEDHINMMATIQKYIDSSISKTINIPTNYPYEDFKNVYFIGWENKLKGLTTFRFNPEIHGGVLLRKEDIANTSYLFILEDGTEVSVKGNEEIEYDGEIHIAANLFDALKEGIYGEI